MTTDNADNNQTIDDTFLREVRAVYQASTERPFSICGPDDVATFVRRVLTDNSREHFIALYLEGTHQVVSYSIVGIGTANACLVHPREVFQRAILAGAISIVVAHNHPSGKPEPSVEDRKVTRQLQDAGELLRIPLLDHVVVTESDFVSILEPKLVA